MILTLFSFSILSKESVSSESIFSSLCTLPVGEAVAEAVAKAVAEAELLLDEPAFD